MGHGPKATPRALGAANAPPTASLVSVKRVGLTRRRLRVMSSVKRERSTRAFEIGARSLPEVQEDLLLSRDLLVVLLFWCSHCVCRAVGLTPAVYNH